MAALNASLVRVAPVAGASVSASKASTSSVRLASSFAGRTVSVSTQSAMSGASLKVERGDAVVVMMKKGIHPEWHAEAKVFCNGEEVIAMGGTKPEYVVDVWSGNHPFYQDQGGGVMVVDEGRVNRFKRMYEGIEDISKVASINDPKKTTADAEA